MAEGRLRGDLLGYQDWLKEKNGALLGRWNNPQYVKVRNANVGEVLNGREPTHRVSKKIDIWMRS
jgi:hypothetical protein